jgi:hypothetical protein
MKKIISSIIILTGFIILNSCKERIDKSGNILNPANTNQPAALQEPSKNSITSYSRNKGGNIVLELYDELTESDSSLADMEKRNKNIYDDYNTLTADYNTYASKSENYYSGANHLIDGINDKIVQTKIRDLIIKSTAKNNLTKAGLLDIVQLIETKKLSIEDEKCVLQIAVTLPLIEKYQKDELPDTKDYLKLAQQQDSLKLFINNLLNKARY